MNNKMPLPTEHQIQNQLLGFLRMKGYFCIRLNAGKYSVGEGRNRRFVMGVEAGIADLLAIKHGKCFFIEVKRSAKHKATPLQLEKMKELEEYGAVCIIASSIEDLKELEMG